MHQMSVLINMCIPSCHDALANAVIRACDLPSIIQICPRPLSVQSMCADETIIRVRIDTSVIWITQLNVTKPFIWNWPVECCCYTTTHLQDHQIILANLNSCKLYYVVILSWFLYLFSFFQDHSVSRLTGKISIWFLLHYFLWLAISNMESCSKTSLISPWLCLLNQLSLEKAFK